MKAVTLLNALAKYERANGSDTLARAFRRMAKATHAIDAAGIWGEAAEEYADELMAFARTLETGRPELRLHKCAGGCGKKIGNHVEKCWRCRVK